jgi:hypothetical protein
MRSQSLIGWAIAATAACCLVEVSQTNGIVGYYRDTVSALTFACWLAGLAAATISAPTCAILFWSLAKRLTGHALLPAMLLFVICPIAYFAALGARIIGRHWWFGKVR